MIRFFSFVLIFCAITSCDQQPTQTSPFPSIQLSGAEKWDINGTPEEIEGTSLIVFPDGSHLFTVRVLVDFEPNENHQGMAREIAKYAMNHGYLNETLGVAKDNKPVDIVPKIGVALIKRANATVGFYARSFRYQFDLKLFNLSKFENTNQEIQQYLGRWRIPKNDGFFEIYEDNTIKIQTPKFSSTGQYQIDNETAYPWIDILWDNGEYLRTLIWLDGENLKMEPAFPFRGRPRSISAYCSVLVKGQTQTRSD